jgi:hypothetical protein
LEERRRKTQIRIQESLQIPSAIGSALSLLLLLLLLIEAACRRKLELLFSCHSKMYHTQPVDAGISRRLLSASKLLNCFCLLIDIADCELTFHFGWDCFFGCTRKRHRKTGTSTGTG